MYGYFYQGRETDQRSETPRPELQVIDNRTLSNEIIVNDGHYRYQLTKYDSRHYYCTCRDLQGVADDISSSCDQPLSLIQATVLNAISFLTEEHLLIHAGSVSWRNAGLVMAGNSGVGKTTLTSKLVMNGCKFLSDEIACFNLDRQMLEPFPRKLSLHQESLEFLGLSLNSEAPNVFSRSNEGLWIGDIEDIVPRSLAEATPPRFLLFLRGFGENPRLEQVANSNALFELMKFSIGPLHDRALLVFQFAPLVNEMKCFNLVVGGVSETAERIMRLVEKEE
jgi:hypothetical protein